MFKGTHLDLSTEHPVDNLPNPINNQSDKENVNTHSLIIQIRVDPQEARCKVAILNLGNTPSMVVQTEVTAGCILG